MGYGGKVEARAQARELRAQSKTLVEIATELGVAKSSVSVWVRDVEFVPAPRNRGHALQRPHPMMVRKEQEISDGLEHGRTLLGRLSRRELLVAGTALYAGEGSKTDGTVKFANTDPRMIVLFLVWLRTFFDIDERRLRLILYLHEDQDLPAANQYWSEVTGIPERQFTKPYRAVADRSIRRRKHPMGCPAIVYNHSATHRRVIGLVAALLSPGCLPG